MREGAEPQPKPVNHAAIAVHAGVASGLAHRRELIKQTSDKLLEVGCDHGVLLPGYSPKPDERLQVASIATLHARTIRSGAMPEADVVVIDEAHHARADTYEKIVGAYPEA